MEIPRSIETLKKTFDEAIKLYMLEILRSLWNPFETLAELVKYEPLKNFE